MLQRAALALLIAGCAGGVSAAGCGDNTGSAVVDGGGGAADAASSIDADLAGDGNVPLAWVDFAITGCSGGLDAGDAGVPTPCQGTVPLSLSFTAISPAPIDIYRWTFGDDGAESTEASPSHDYLSPGTYDVGLAVGGLGGTATEAKAGIIVVSSATMGSPCAADPQCGAGLECVCADDASCGEVLPNGLCSEACSDANPCGEGVCADLDPTAAADADWRRSLCVPACSESSDCPSGLSCQNLRADGGTAWVRGCFAPRVLGSVGDVCFDGAGLPVHAACASGQCLALGARGVCGIACSGGDCPAGSACATFQDAGIGATCVDRCETASECSDDPWLRCEAPGGTGDPSFTVDETAAADGYCAPRTCTAPDECGPEGACVDGYCAAAS